jgi:exodeoxyribonuclease-3
MIQRFPAIGDLLGYRLTPSAGVPLDEESMPLRVMSFNANGIRSAAKKGFFDWFARQKTDVLCVQELKAKEEQILGSPFERRGYHRYVHEAVKPGYSGVALYSRVEPNEVIVGLGADEFDAEGRYLEAIFDDVAVVSLYLPSGSAGEHRQASKFRFLELFEDHLAGLRKKSVPYILCGDFNIAHKEIDLKNWRGNKKNSGFLPEEREWMERVLTTGGYVDAFRVLNQQPDQYTWWSARGQARAKNVGWRIDYHVVAPELEDKIEKVAIYTKKMFSDHAPLTIDYGI